MIPAVQTGARPSDNNSGLAGVRTCDNVNDPTAKLNVAVFLDSGTLSGTEKRAAKIANAMNKRGHRVTLFMTPKTRSALVLSDYAFDWPPITVWRYPAWLRFFGRTRFAGLRKLIGLDALLQAARRWYLGGLLAQHRISIAHVYLVQSRCHDITVPHLFEITSPDKARSLIEAGFSFPTDTLLHPNSEGVDAVLGDRYPQNDRIVAPHAFFDPLEPTDFLAPQKRNVVVFGHRLVERKNPVMFARVAKRFVALRNDWKIAIRGTGPLEKEVRAVISDEVESGRIEFGFKPNLMDELYRSRIFVSIESEDNYSNQSVLEAMWCRNALLLSDRGHTRARYFAKNGLLCEPDEENVLAALLRLTEADDLLNTYAENGRRHVETAFSAEAYLDHLEAVYQQCASTR